MILYSEKQLLEAYKIHIKGLKEVPNVQIPTLEQFRIIYEDFWIESLNEDE
jgi:hypothetical protein|tara:strand:- start:1217 stop:1369 length:153 start_codon:yes stop_codon:yes gene_type:complete